MALGPWDEDVKYWPNLLFLRTRNNLLKFKKTQQVLCLSLNISTI